MIISIKKNKAKYYRIVFDPKFLKQALFERVPEFSLNSKYKSFNSQGFLFFKTKTRFVKHQDKERSTRKEYTMICSCYLGG